MKIILKAAVLFGILVLLSVVARAAEDPKAPENFYFAGEYGISLGGDATSPDLETGRIGWSGTIKAYPLLNWGVGLNANSQRLDEDYRIAPLLLWRLPVNRAALLAEAGPEYDLEAEDWSLRVSVGPAFRLSKNLEFSLLVGARKFFGRGRQDQTIESVTTAQVSYFFGGK